MRPWHTISFRLLLIAAFFAVILAFKLGSVHHGRDFLTSDGAIKYYQIMGSQGRPVFDSSRFECAYNGRHLDTDFSFFPYRTAWGILSGEGDRKTCLFYYPIVLTIVLQPFFLLLGSSTTFIVPVIFFALSFFLFAEFLIDGGIIGRYLFSLFAFLLSFPVLTALDFSEVSFTTFAFVLYLVYLRRLSLDAGESSATPPLYFPVLVGLASGLAIILRPETSAGYLIITFLHAKAIGHRKALLNLSASVLAGALATLIAVGIYRYYEHTWFGIRFQHAAGATFDARGYEHIARKVFGNAWQNEWSYGFLQSIPWVLLVALAGIPWVFRRLGRRTVLFGLAAVLFLLLLSIISPFSAGVGYFGNRFFEPGAILGCVFLWGLLAAFWRNLHSAWARAGLVLFFLVVLYPGYKFNASALKTYRAHAASYHRLQDYLDRMDSRTVVHTNPLSNSFLGYSYLTKEHFLVLSQDELTRFVQNLEQTNSPRFTIMQPIMAIGPENLNLDLKKGDIVGHYRVAYTEPLEAFRLTHLESIPR